jgi:Putative transposase
MARRIAATIRCRFRISKSSRPWSAAVQPPWAATSSDVTPVVLSDPRITPVETAPPQADQSLAKLKWLEKQKSETLPVGYFHLVFTLPHELNGLILTNKKILLSHLFKAVGETLVDFGHTRLGGQIGFITVLHTWDQTLLDHFHLHCLVPAGALSHDQKRWSPARKNFLFPIKALSLVFCGKFLDLLQSAFATNKLLFVGQSACLANPIAFKLLINALRKKPWVVYAKKPFVSPVHVLDYLGRYTHRVALSNDRILSAHNAEVTFSYRDRKNENRKKTMTLDAHEFIRRFLLHVIPKGFVRVRHFGFLANRSKGLLAKCRQLLDLSLIVPKLPTRSVQELMLQLTGIDITRCPLCQKGTLVFFANLPVPAPWDSS